MEGKMLHGLYLLIKTYCEKNCIELHDALFSDWLWIQQGT